MRWGIARDDSHYLPIFPFAFYNRLDGEDLIDLKAFLDSLPPVSRTNRTAIRHRFAAARGAIAVVASPFPGPWRADPAKDAAWNRGAYLVDTVGRCGQCHTPTDWLGTPDSSRTLAGAAAGNGRKAAPNITADQESGIGRWSEADIVTLLSEGQTPEFDFVGGGMAEIVGSTSRLDDADRRAIAVYLRSVPPVSSPKKE